MVVYTAQYEAPIEGTFRPAVRCDSAHGRPHSDVLDWDGETVEKIWFDETNLNTALTSAVNTIVAEWVRLRDDFLRRRS